MRRSKVVPQLLMILGLIPCLAGAGTESQDLIRAGRVCEKGDRALAAGQIERARTQYEKAITIVPRFPEAHIGLGNIGMLGKAFSEPLTHYETARDGYSEFAEALNLYRRGRYTTAQTQILDLQDAIASLQAPRTSRGDAAYQISKIENRIATLRSVLPPSAADEAGPPGQIYFLIGNALFRLGRVEEAIEQWKLCRERAPGFGPAANNLAMATLQLGRIGEARRHLAQADDLGFKIHPQLRQEIEGGS